MIIKCAKHILVLLRVIICVSVFPLVLLPGLQHHLTLHLDFGGEVNVLVVEVQLGIHWFTNWRLLILRCSQEALLALGVAGP